MATTWLDPAILANHKRVIIEGLINGQNRARELQSLLNNRRGGVASSSRSEEELAMEIVTSFTESLAVLREPSLFGGDDHYSGTATVKAEHSHCGDRSFEDSGESKKRPGQKDRRGCYKRRKNSESWTTVLSTVEDGQAWRKYGQKEILNAKYPRAYFRCTRKYDQGCQATKQVQQIQDNPKLYKTTYIGNHTCRMIRATQMNMDASDPPALDSHAPPPPPPPPPPAAAVSSESGSICSKKVHDGDHVGHLSISSSMFPTLPVKEEESNKERTTTSSGLTDNVNDTSNMWPEDDFAFPANLDLDLGKSINFVFDFDAFS